MSMDGFSMSALAEELNQRLTGGRIDKIFQIDGLELLLWVRQPGENIRLTLSASPEHAKIHLTQENTPNPPIPPAFCMLLRKHLEDGRISRVYQLGRDRVLTIDIDTRGEHGLIVTKQLIAEIMGKHSNVIFAQDGIIIDALRRVGPAQSRYRHILPGRGYVTPPGGPDRLDPLHTTQAEIIRNLDNKTGSLIKALIAVSEGIGPVSAREFIYRSGLPVDIAVEAMDFTQKSQVALIMTEIAAKLKTGPTQPTVVFTESNRLLGIAAFPLLHLADGEVQHFQTVSEAVEFADKLKGTRQPEEKQILSRLLTAEITKLNRKKIVLQEELQQAENADEYRQKADILMAYLYQLPASSAEACLPNFYNTQDDTSLIKIELDPQKSPVQNANSYYQKYNKFKRAQESLAAQLTQTAQETLYLESLQLSLDYAQTAEDYNEIRQELAASGYLRLPAKRRSFKQPLSTPLIYRLADGYTVLIGKNNRQNDMLTMKQAKQDDIWLHTKDIPGSHVIIRTEGRAPGHDIITQAARLAAYYSKARQSSNVPVDYTRRRYVKKPSGAKPGFVTYDHQSTVNVTPPLESEIKLFE